MCFYMQKVFVFEKARREGGLEAFSFGKFVGINMLNVFNFFSYVEWIFEVLTPGNIG